VPRSRVIWNRAAFTADTREEPISEDAILGLEFGFDCLQNGATAPTLAQLISAVGNVIVRHGGDTKIEIDFPDLVALNMLWLGRYPQHVLPGGDNEVGFISGVFCPIERARAGRSMGVQVLYDGHATIDTEKLTGAVLYGLTGKGRAISIATKIATASTTFQEINLDRVGAKLIGLLLYSTTIPSTSDANCSQAEVKLLVGGHGYGHYHWWGIPPSPVSGPIDDTALGAEMDNYRSISFEADPVPADNLKLHTKSIGATDAIKVIAIYSEA